MRDLGRSMGYEPDRDKAELVGGLYTRFCDWEVVAMMANMEQIVALNHFYDWRDLYYAAYDPEEHEVE